MNRKYFCRECRGDRNHKILHKEIITGSISEYCLNWEEKFCIIQCLGCDTISFLKIYSDSEMWFCEEEENGPLLDEKIFPRYLEKGIELNTFYLPDNVKHIYEETVEALKNNLSILSAGGLRTIVEAICNYLKIKEGNLSDRIDGLVKEGYLTNIEAKRLHAIRFLGNDALHEVNIPNKDSIYILFDITNHLLENLFIQDKKMGSNIMKPIDEYSEFIDYLERCIKNDMIGKIYKIPEILGGFMRLIKKKSVLEEFAKQLNEDIKSNTIDYLNIINEDNKEYKVLKMPILF